MRFISWLPIVVVAYLAVGASSAPAQGWQTETILPFASFHTPSIAIGDDHIPHLAVTSSNGALLYLSKINGVWQYELVASDYLYGSRGLRLGPDGAHVSWRDTCTRKPDPVGIDRTLFLPGRKQRRPWR